MTEDKVEVNETVHVHYHVRYSVMSTVARKMSNDPCFQLKWHKVMTWFWVVNIVTIPYLFFFQGRVWDKMSIFYLVIISIYANFSTEWGAIPAAQSSIIARRRK